MCYAVMKPYWAVVVKLFRQIACSKNSRLVSDDCLPFSHFGSDKGSQGCTNDLLSYLDCLL